jgi:hypothetical protein
MVGRTLVSMQQDTETTEAFRFRHFAYGLYDKPTASATDFPRQEISSINAFAARRSDVPKPSVNRS